MNLEKLHLPADRPFNNTQKENIHGIDCIAATNTSSGTSSNANSNLSIGILDSIHFIKITKQLNSSTEILLKSIHELRNNLFYIKISLFSNCIFLFTVILLVAFFKRDHLIDWLNCRNFNIRYNTLSDQTVKYSNEQIRVE